MVLKGFLSLKVDLKNMKELKMVVAGLANAGKTSILRVLDDDFEKISELAPTQGVEYNNYKVLGLNVTAWDLGGQISYREKYMQDYQNYFSNAVVLFYVIDIQAEALFEESVKFLKDIVDIFPKVELKDVYIVILLHKFDLHVQKPEVRIKVSGLKEKITTVLSKIPSVFYYTTIYEPYSIFHAISDGILHQMSGRAMLHQKIKELAEELGSPAAMLSSNKGYPYGIWYSDKVQILELAKFYRSNFNSKWLFLKEEECRQLACSENFGTLIITFKYKAQPVLFSLMVPNGADLEAIRLALPKQINELQKVLNLLKF